MPSSATVYFGEARKDAWEEAWEEALKKARNENARWQRAMTSAKRRHENARHRKTMARITR
jgi:hypothetical protein